MTSNNLIVKFVVAVWVAYFPIWIFGVLAMALDFFFFKSVTQQFIISVMSFLAASVLFHEIGHLFAIKAITKIPYNSINVTAQLWRMTLIYPSFDQKTWIIVAAGSSANILAAILGWILMTENFYREIWFITQFTFGFINLMPFSPDGEKLFTYYYQHKYQ